jgi:hypothetical protein
MRAMRTRSLARFALALLAGGCILAVACGRSDAPPASGAAPAATAPAADTTPAAAAPAPPTATLRGLGAGDRACYVLLETAAGEVSQEGDFELCPGGTRDATPLIGQRVTWTTERANVLAAACEGNPDCGLSDEVDLVVRLEPVPAS